MGNFANNAITEGGRVLLADVQAGAVFIPTKIVIGSGNIPAGKTPATMTGVATVVKELGINKKERTPDGKCIIGGVYTNEDITTDFYFRELALYAKAEYRAADGTVTKEVSERLYSYGNAGNTADLMPAYSTSTAVEKQLDLVIWIGNDAQVDLTIASGLYLDHAEKHASWGEDPITPEMIGAVRAGKDIPDGADLNDYKETGEYYKISGANTLLNYPSAFGSFAMKVERTGSYGVGVIQTIKDHKGNVYVRAYAAESDDDWTTWGMALASNRNAILNVPANGGYRIKNSDTGAATDFMAGRGYSVMRIMDTFDDVSNYREIMLVGANASPSVANSVRLLDVSNGQGVSYEIIHEGNINQYVTNLAPATVE